MSLFRKGRELILPNKKVRSGLKNQWVGFFFVLPSLMGVLVFVLLPFADAANRSFREAMSSKFVYFKNYGTVFYNEAFKLAVSNTLRFIAYCIPMLVALSLLMAVLVSKGRHKPALFKTSLLIPMAIPVASVVLIWQLMFHQNGLLSGFVGAMGYGRVNWLKSEYAFWVLVFTYIWRNLGYDMILWLAGLSNISTYLYEAAAIDGAGAFQQFFYITLPNLTTTLFTILVLSLLNSFKVFREAYLISGDYPHGSIYMLQHLFNNWFTALDMDKLSAGAVIVSIVIFAVILIFKNIWGKEEGF